VNTGVLVDNQCRVGLTADRGQQDSHFGQETEMVNTKSKLSSLTCRVGHIADRGLTEVGLHSEVLDSALVIDQCRVGVTADRGHLREHLDEGASAINSKNFSKHKRRATWTLIRHMIKSSASKQDRLKLAEKDHTFFPDNRFLMEDPASGLDKPDGSFSPKQVFSNTSDKNKPEDSLDPFEEEDADSKPGFDMTVVDPDEAYTPIKETASTNSKASPKLKEKGSVTRTRSGRVVKPPVKMTDYILTISKYTLF